MYIYIKTEFYIIIIINGKNVWQTTIILAVWRGENLEMLEEKGRSASDGNWANYRKKKKE